MIVRQMASLLHRARDCGEGCHVRAASKRCTFGFFGRASEISESLILGRELEESSKDDTFINIIETDKTYKRAANFQEPDWTPQKG